MGRVAAIARVFYLLILGVWAGAGGYHLLVVVPSAFAAFASKHDALAFLGRGAAELDRFGMAAGPVLLLLLLVGWLGQGRGIGARALGVLLLIAGAVVSGLWLGPRITTLEGELMLGAPVSDALNQLYTASDGVLIGTVALAVLLLLSAPLGAGARPGSRIELGVRP